MHEISLVTALMEQVEDLAKQQDFTMIKHIKLAVGEISGVNSEALLFCFPEVVKGSILSSAELIVDSIPAIIYCSICRSDSTPTDRWALICENCGSMDIRVKSGKEFKIIELVVDSPFRIG